jgi:hypothetical protein
MHYGAWFNTDNDMAEVVYRWVRLEDRNATCTRITMNQGEEVLAKKIKETIARE